MMKVTTDMLEESIRVAEGGKSESMLALDDVTKGQLLTVTVTLPVVFHSQWSSG